jgi:hypothetical protein
MLSLLDNKLLSLPPSMRRLIYTAIMILLLASLMATVTCACASEINTGEIKNKVTSIDYENEPVEEETNTASKAGLEQTDDDESKLISAICQPGSIILLRGNFSGLTIYWPVSHPEIISPPPQMIA